MTTQVEPLSKTVKAAVRRHQSPVRHAAPVLGKLFHILMFLAVVGACGFGLACLWRAALDDTRFRIQGDLLGMDGTVRQCPEALPAISVIGSRFNGRSLLDPFLVSDLEAAYRECLWVKRVTRLRRSFPNRISLELELRMPAAQVRSGGKYWLVDIHGVVLPVAGGAEPFERLPEIVGVTSQTIMRRPAPGVAWGDEGVVGGLGVMRAFWGSPLSEVLPVARVVVNTGVFRAGEGGGMKELRRRFEVVTKTGAVVRWGAYNPEDAGDELTSAEKMLNLEGLLSRGEALRSGVCFDVRTRLPGFSLVK